MYRRKSCSCEPCMCPWCTLCTNVTVNMEEEKEKKVKSYHTRTFTIANSHGPWRKDDVWKNENLSVATTHVCSYIDGELKSHALSFCHQHQHLSLENQDMEGVEKTKTSKMNNSFVSGRVRCTTYVVI